jgi:very-short-patch-repair endonuclease
MPEYDRLNTTAGRQHGLVTTRQLKEYGFSRMAVATMVQTDRLQRLRRGVFRLCGVPATWRSSGLAVILSVGDGVVLSHRSAAALWGLIDHHGLGVIEISGDGHSRQAGTVSHRRPVAAAHRTVHDGIPVTTVARTLSDLAECSSGTELGRLVDEALRRRLTTLEQFHTAATRRFQGRDRTAARAILSAVLAERGIGYDPGANDWERAMDRSWEDWRLPAARRQFRIRVANRSYRVDRAIVELKIGVEWNGRATHGTRSGFEYDTSRRNRLQAAGWRVLEFHPRSTPAEILATVRAVCEERRQQIRDSG